METVLATDYLQASPAICDRNSNVNINLLIRRSASTQPNPGVCYINVNLVEKTLYLKVIMLYV